MSTDENTCRKCGVDEGFYQKQIRRLREKLEYTELNNFKLLSECNRLRKELREAEFRGRSSVSRRPSLILPDDILHEIFSFAICVEGELVSRHWRVNDPYPPWVISSQARRSIPLVCRQWYDVGLEYLYQHVVIFTQHQLASLLSILDYFDRDPEIRQKRLGWIRGLEFILPRDDIESTKRICGLIGKLPQGRLRLFGFEDAICHSEKSWKLMEIVADALHKAQGSLEVLHLPCIRAQEDNGDSIYYPSESGDFSLRRRGFMGLSKLRTLSLTSGRWEQCIGARRSDQEKEFLSFLMHNPHSINTLYVNWMYGTQLLSSKHLDFLRPARHLQTIHIVTDHPTLQGDNFDRFLEAVPHMRRLVLTPSDRKRSRDTREPPPDAISHPALEEIVLVMDLSSSYKTITIISPIFCKVQSGHLPSLKRVVIRGPYPEGCIDSRLVLSQKHSQGWKDAIQACAEREVDMVDDEGNAIHLWSARHGIRVECGEEDTESDVSSSEDGEWWELSASEVSEGTVASDDVISNDSEDSPYRYVSQPDLDYDSNSVL